MRWELQYFRKPYFLISPLWHTHSQLYTQISHNNGLNLSIKTLRLVILTPVICPTGLLHVPWLLRSVRWLPVWSQSPVANHGPSTLLPSTQPPWWEAPTVQPLTRLLTQRTRQTGRRTLLLQSGKIEGGDEEEEDGHRARQLWVQKWSVCVSTSYIHTCTLDACVWCVNTRKKRVRKDSKFTARTVYTSICLNANWTTSAAALCQLDSFCTRSKLSCSSSFFLHFIL